MFERFKISAPVAFVLLLSPMISSVWSVAAPVAIEEVPSIWEQAAGVATITEGVSVRTMTSDETWGPEHPPVQLLEITGGSRTIVLPAADLFENEAGSTLSARVTTAPGARVLFRKPNGELVAFWGEDDKAQTQWVSFTSNQTNWNTRVCFPEFAAPLDGEIAILGTTPVSTPSGSIRPASGRTVGYSLRFATDSRDLFIAAEGESIRFRVLADETVIAKVRIERNSAEKILIPVHLGDVASRRIEILADELIFAGIETPDSRLGVRSWNQSVPLVRMLWITDESAESGTHGYPWVAARVLNQDVWVRSWGDNATAVVGEDRNAVPVDAIEQDIASIDPDLVVISGQFFDQSLHVKEYKKVAGRWLKAIKSAIRPEAVRVVLSSWQHNGSVDKDLRKRADVFRKQAKHHDFAFVDGQDWLEGRSDDTFAENAHSIVSADGIRPTDRGNDYIGYNFAEALRRLKIESKAQTASVRRRQAANTRNIASTDTSP